MLRVSKSEFQDRINKSLEYNGAEATVKIVGAIPTVSTSFAVLKCSKHGRFEKRLAQIPRTPKKNRLVCPKCSMESKDAERVNLKYLKFVKDLAGVHNGSISLVGGYVDMKTKADFKCAMCGNISSCYPGSKLKHGCMVCANARRQHAVGKNVTLDGVKFKLEGFEEAALKYMLESTNLRARDIAGASSGKVPSVSYTFKDDGKRKYSHYYHPDFFVRKTNTLIEVKSTVTLGIHTPYLYRKNRAKAKACVRLGYKHTLVLVLPGQGSIAVDKWYLKSRKSFLAMLRDEYLLRV